MRDRTFSKHLLIGACTIWKHLYTWSMLHSLHALFRANTFEFKPDAPTHLTVVDVTLKIDSEESES